MNKKLNTVLFIAGATLFNIFVTALFFMLLLIAYARFIMQRLPEGAQAWSFPLIFIAALAISFALYQCVLKAMQKKASLDSGK